MFHSFEAGHAILSEVLLLLWQPGRQTGYTLNLDFIISLQEN